MAEGGYDPDTTNPFDPHGDDDDDNDTTPLVPHRYEEGTEMRHRTPVIRYPPTTKTSTSKGGVHETSFIDTPSGGLIFASREQAREELNKDIHEVFPNINKKLLPHIRRDDYNRLVVNLGKTNSKDWVIAHDGRPSRDMELSKFPKGLRSGLGKTNEQINQEAYEKQKEKEEKLAKIEQEREEASRAKAENNEKLQDAKDRLANLENVLGEKMEAKKRVSSPDEEEDIDKSITSIRKSIKDVGREVDGHTKDRGRLEQATIDADARVEEGERQVETARERVNERLLSLRDRIKEIFKKHGFTVIAVATAIGTVIGVIVSNLKAGLTKVAKGVGDGMKELGKKLGEILPGMIGAIASFLFRTAGEVIGFLAKNAWLLIVGLVVLAVEQFKKKSR